MKPHEQEGKELRKIKPYPQVAPDEFKPIEKYEFDAISWLVGAASAMLFVIGLILIGIAAMAWGLLV